MKNGSITKNWAFITKTDLNTKVSLIYIKFLKTDSDLLMNYNAPLTLRWKLGQQKGAF